MADEPSKNDIDFDELDKAVTSLMGKVGGETTDGDTEATKTLEINSTLQPGQAPQYEKLEKTAEKIGDSALDTDKDVVVDTVTAPQPNESAPITTPAPAAPAQQLPVPNTPIATPPVPAPAATPPAPAPAAPAPSAPLAARPNSGRFMDMVHPKADMRAAPPSSTASAPSRATTTIMPLSKPAQSPAANSAPPLAPDVPIATPFLPDAKVEKRPLGSGAPPKRGDVLAPVLDETGNDDGASYAAETLPINGEGSKNTSADIDSQRTLDPLEFQKASETEQVLAQIELNEAKPEEGPQTIETVESGDTENLKAGKPTYQEVQATSADGNAIFDVKDYHQPLAHPKKQKSGWGVVVIVLVIIVLAAALGAAAYFILGLGT